MFMKVSSADALARLASGRTDFLRFVEKADFDVGLYKPAGVDTQAPHARDEVYIITKGSGTLVCEAERTTFNQSDVLFVPAGAHHRFEDFTDDFCA